VIHNDERDGLDLRNSEAVTKSNTKPCLASADLDACRNCLPHSLRAFKHFQPDQTPCDLNDSPNVPIMFSCMGSRSRTRSLAYWLLPKELRDQPPETLGDAMVLGHHVWIRCAGCSHSAVILPAVLAQLVGYDFPLARLTRRMKCRQCGEKRVRVRAVEPGER